MRKSAVQEEKGLTLMEVLVVVFMLVAILTPIIFYFGRNLNKVAELRSASIALNLTKEGAEKVRSSNFILGSVYVYKAGKHTFVEGYTAPTAKNLKLRVIRMGSSSPLTVSISSGTATATATIAVGDPPGTIIDMEGEPLANVTDAVVTITGGSFKDRFDIIYQYPYSIQTVNEASWRTTYEFTNPSTPLEVTVKVFKDLATDPLAELVTRVESLK